jgi:hypothetical protein
MFVKALVSCSIHIKTGKTAIYLNSMGIGQISHGRFYVLQVHAQNAHAWRYVGMLKF